MVHAYLCSFWKLFGTSRIYLSISSHTTAKVQKRSHCNRLSTNLQSFYLGRAVTSLQPETNSEWTKYSNTPWKTPPRSSSMPMPAQVVWRVFPRLSGSLSYKVYDNPIQQLRPRRIGRLIKDNSFGTPFTCPLPTYPGCYSCLRAVALVLVVEVIYFCLSQRLAPQSSRCSNHPRGRHDSAVTGRPKSALEKAEMLRSKPARQAK